MCIFQLRSFKKLNFKVQTSFSLFSLSKFCSPLSLSLHSSSPTFKHDFLWWWACSWLIFPLKWRLQSPLLFFHYAAIDLQESNDSIDKEDPRSTSSTCWIVPFASNKVRAIIVLHNRFKRLHVWGISVDRERMRHHGVI